MDIRMPALSLFDKVLDLFKGKEIIFAQEIYRIDTIVPIIRSNGNVELKIFAKKPLDYKTSGWRFVQDVKLVISSEEFFTELRLFDSEVAKANSTNVFYWD